MKSSLAAIVTGIMFFAACSCDADSLPDYTTEERIDDELYMVKEIWYGRGEVIVGKIDPLPPGVIGCRTPIYKDGSFTAAVYGGRELTFYLHGYNKLSVDGVNRIRRNVSDAGVVKLVTTPEGDLRQWGAVIEAPGFEGEITARLNVVNKDYLFDDHGYSGGARPFARAAIQKIKPGEKIVFKGISPIPYQVVISAPGFIQQEHTIDLGAKGLIESDVIELKRAPVLEFMFRSRTRQRGGEWQEDPEVKRERVPCDGKAELLLTNVRDGLGNSMELRLKPKEEGVEAGFFYYNKENFIQLGEGEVTAELHWDDITRENGLPYPMLQSGHYYLLQVKDKNGVDLETLFSVRAVN